MNPTNDIGALKEDIHNTRREFLRKARERGIDGKVALKLINGLLDPRKLVATIDCGSTRNYSFLSDPAISESKERYAAQFTTKQFLALEYEEPRLNLLRS